MIFTPHTNLRVLLLYIVITITFICTGCQTDLPIPVEPPTDDPSEQWQSLLEQSVSLDGVDWTQIEGNQNLLEQYVAWVGTVGPQSNRRNDTRFPRRGRANHKLVHWINAYNGWMMYSYLHHGKPTDVSHIDASNGYLWGQRIYIDGEYTSFSHVKHERILADFQDPRLHFMLYELTEQSPLPKFWTAERWKTQVNLFIRKFLATGQGAIETGDGWAFHPIFKRYQKDFIDWSQHDTLCEWLIEYTNGKLKLWLTQANQTGCRLNFVEESTKIPVGLQNNSPVAE